MELVEKSKCKVVGLISEEGWKLQKDILTILGKYIQGYQSVG
jgi:hypothetical protein